MRRLEHTLHTRLAWATPIQPEVLGAHLEAYMEHIPAITTLRLCHRFGSNAVLSQLPVELRQMIEDYLILPEQEVSRKRWQALLNCHRKRCRPTDHFSKDELKKIHDEYVDSLGGADTDFYDPEDTEFVRWLIEEGGGTSLAYFDPEEDLQYLDDFIVNDTNPLGYRREDADSDDDCYEIPGWGDRREERCEDYRAQWGPTVRCMEYRGTHQANVLYEHFGLTAWAETVRPESSSAGGKKEAVRTTMAYLTLPGSTDVRESWDVEGEGEVNDDYHGDQCFFMGGSSMELGLQSSLPPGAEEKFKRAVEMLALKPHVARDQQCAMLSPVNIDIKNAQSQKQKDWMPRLTMLVRTKIRSED